MTYSTIVAGVADLEADAHVLERACEQARVNDATLLLVTSFDPVSARDKARAAETTHGISNDVALSETEAYELVERARDLAVSKGVGLAQGVVVEGRAGDSLTLVAIESQADLVVVGSQGVDTLMGRVFGAVSIQVLRKAKCDVLVVVDEAAASV